MTTPAPARPASWIQVDELALGVRLPEGELMPAALGVLLQPALDLRQRQRAVDVGSRRPRRLRFGPLRT